MPILPLLDASLFHGLSVCERCDARIPSMLLGALQARSLRTFAEVAQQASDGAGMPACPHCAGRLKLLELAYAFEEPDMATLRLDVETGQYLYAQSPVQDEERLAELAGRPFSVADLHRTKLTGLTDPVAYEVGDAVITVAGLAPDPEADPAAFAESVRAAYRQAKPLLDKQNTGTDTDALMTRVGWHDDPTTLAWLGDPAQDLIDGRIAAQNLIRVDKLLAALSYRPAGMPEDVLWPEVEIEREGKQISDVWLVWEGLKARLDVDEMCASTVTGPFTGAEAAAVSRGKATRVLQIAHEVLQQLPAEITNAARVLPGPRLALAWHDNPGEPTVDSADWWWADLSRLAQRMNWDAAAVTDTIVTVGKRILSGAMQTSHDIMPCGCEAEHGVCVRPLDQLDDQAHREHAQLPGIAVCAVLDCEHHTVFVSEGELGDAENLWQDVREGMRGQQWQAHARPVFGIDGQLTGLVAAGDNVASVLADPALVRGFVHATGLPSQKQLGVYAVSRNIIGVGIDGHDPEIMRREVATLARELRSGRHAMAEPLRAELQVAGEGEQFGHFSVFELEGSQAHPMARFHDK